MFSDISSSVELPPRALGHQISPMDIFYEPVTSQTPYCFPEITSALQISVGESLLCNGISSGKGLRVVLQKGPDSFQTIQTMHALCRFETKAKTTRCHFVSLALSHSVRHRWAALWPRW